MTSYILSIHNKWVELIKNGTKKYEFRSLRYSNLKVGNKIYICETNRTKHMTRIGKGFVYCCYCGTKNLNTKCTSLITGEFIINKILRTEEIIKELNNHPGRNSNGLAFEISELKTYMRPKLLAEFNIKKAPQFYYKVKENVEID